MLTVDEYYEIRRLVKREGLSQREVARRLGRSRKTVRKALRHSEPPGYRRSQEPLRPMVDSVRGIIDAWLEDDKRRHRKQRHTGKRIWERLVEEYAFTGSYSAVKRYVAYRLSRSGEVFIPLEFGPGEEAQFDWGEADAVINGVERRVFLFCVRSCYSGACFVRGYETEKQEAFLDGHVRAFEFFGGVPRRGCYDNLKTAVIAVGKGQERVLTDRFRDLRSHYVFDVRFCNVARGNEKGHVENLVKHVQRTFMTPVPACADLGELNGHLDRMCLKELERKGVRSEMTRGELLAEERAAMLPLPRVRFDACVRRSTIVGKDSLVQFDGNYYSVPVEHAHHPCLVRGFVDRVEVCVAERTVAVHGRSWEKGEYLTDWRHYVPMLRTKPGALSNGRPFRGEPWGEAFTRMELGLEERYGGEGARQYVRILLLFTRHPEGQVKWAVKRCVRRGVFSYDAVCSTLNYEPPRRIGALDLSRRPELARVGSGTRPAKTYDALLARREAGA
jgi:transposase